MGLVQQEPVLFNYSIIENILYGKKDASNSEILEAAEIANAKEFIESSVLTESFDSRASVLLKGMKDYEVPILEKLGGNREEYNSLVDTLTKIDEKERKEGKF